MYQMKQKKKKKNKKKKTILSIYKQRHFRYRWHTHSICGTTVDTLQLKVKSVFFTTLRSYLNQQRSWGCNVCCGPLLMLMGTPSNIYGLCVHVYTEQPGIKPLDVTHIIVPQSYSQPLNSSTTKSKRQNFRLQIFTKRLC